MSKVAILTDSSAGFSPEEAEALKITIAPLHYTIDGVRYNDGDPAGLKAYLNYQRQTELTPKVKPPDVSEFEAIYNKLHHQTDKILALHVSARISDALQYSEIGSSALRGRCTIEILDTQSIMLGQKIMVTAAAKAAQQGAGIDEIIRLVRGLVPHIYTVMYVDAMTYLDQSNTVGKAQAILGTMLGIKPLLSIEDGAIIPMEKVKTEPKALDKLTEFVTEFDNINQAIIFQADEEPRPEALELQQRLLNNFDNKPFSIVRYTPLMASFVGPNAIGVVVYESHGNL